MVLEQSVGASACGRMDDRGGVDYSPWSLTAEKIGVVSLSLESRTFTAGADHSWSLKSAAGLYQPRLLTKDRAKYCNRSSAAIISTGRGVARTSKCTGCCASICKPSPAVESEDASL